LGGTKAKADFDSMQGQNARLHYPVDRKIWHQTLMCSVTAAGDAYCPLLVSAEQSVGQILETEARDGINLKVEIASSPYVRQAFFNNYLDKVLIPVVISNCSLASCEKRRFASAIIVLLVALTKC
jgi:hypothetical protein